MAENAHVRLSAPAAATSALAFVAPFTPERCTFSIVRDATGAATTIAFTLQLDASDAAGRNTGQQSGVLPQLDALRALLALPSLVLEWGQQRGPLRVEPVSATIAEYGYDAELNPLHADIALVFRQVQ